MSYAAGPVHFQIDTYSRWAVTMTWYLTSAKTTTKDLSGYTAAMDIRRKQSDSSALIALATGGSGITLGGDAGTITLVLTDTQTAAITPGPGWIAAWPVAVLKVAWLPPTTERMTRCSTSEPSRTMRRPIRPAS